MERTKKTIKNIKYGFVSSVAITILKFVTRTILIYVLGSQYTGMDSLFVSIVGVLNLSELGISSAINYSLYEPVATKNYLRANQIINFYKSLYRLIGVLICFVGVLFIPFLNKVVKNEIPRNENIYILYGISLINTVIGYFLFAYKSSIFIANMQSKEISKIKTISLLLQNFFQIVVLIITKSYVGYLLLAPLFTVLNNLLCSIKATKMYPSYYAAGHLERKEKLKILKNVKGLFIQKIGGVVFTFFDNIIISIFMGLRDVAIYNNYFYIIQFLWTLLNVIETALISSVGNSIVTEHKEKNYGDFKIFNFIYVWIVSVMMTCLLCGYQVFMQVWVGEEWLLADYDVVLFCVYFYVCKMGTMGYVYKEAAGIWIYGQYIPAITAIINLALNVFLTPIMGLAGVLISSIISMGTINFWGYLYILYKKYFGLTSEWILYMLRQFAYMMINFSSAFTVYYLFKKLALEGLMGLLICVLGGFIWQNVVMICVYKNRYEYKQALKFCRSQMKQLNIFV